jgi:ammonia channel protein AmtB
VLAAPRKLRYPSWLNPADNTWQLIAVAVVGLMSVPELGVVYGGLLRSKWVQPSIVAGVPSSRVLGVPS